MMEPNEVLGVEPDASPAEIREAYRTLSRLYHPDRHQSAPSAVQREANRRMQQVNEAYRILMDQADMDVLYATKGWSNRERGRATEALLDAGIPHEWYGIELRIERRYERVADEIMVNRTSPG